MLADSGEDFLYAQLVAHIGEIKSSTVREESLDASDVLALIAGGGGSDMNVQQELKVLFASAVIVGMGHDERW